MNGMKNIWKNAVSQVARLLSLVRKDIPGMCGFLCFAVLTAIGALYHEAWRDEVQAWLIARDVPLSDFFGQMRLEGTPALLHVLLAPFAKTGIPYVIAPFIHWCLIVFAAGLLIFKSPFPRVFSLAILFTPLFAFEYAVVMRNYGISAVLLFLIAMLYRKRFDRPVTLAVLVGLLCNANTHSIGIAAGIGAAFFLDVVFARKFSRRVFLALGVMAGFAFLAFIQVYPPATDNYLVALHAPSLKDAFNGVVSSLNDGLGLPQGNLPLFPLLVIVLAPLAFWRRLQGWAMWLFGIGGLSAVFVFSHGGGLRHHGFYLVITLAFLWIQLENGALKPLPFTRTAGSARALVRGLLLLLGLASVSSLPQLVGLYRNEIRYDYSGAKRAAESLASLKFSDRDVVIYPSPVGASFLAYSRQKTAWYPEFFEQASYCIWRQRYSPSLTFEDIVGRVRIGFESRDDFWLLINYKIPESDLFRLAWNPGLEPFTGNGEQYWIYEPVKKMPPLVFPLSNARVNVGGYFSIRARPWGMPVKCVPAWGSVVSVCRSLAGGGDGSAVSLMLADAPGFFLRHREGVLRAEPYESRPVYQADASFIPVADGRGAGVLLQSRNFPDQYVGMADSGELRLVARERALRVRLTTP